MMYAGQMRVAVVMLVLLTAVAARADEPGPPCPTWEPCGDGGARCYFRALELRATDAACADAFLDAACEAGSGGACFEVGRKSWTHGERGAGLWQMARSIVSDVVRNPWRLYQPPVVCALLGLMLLEALFLRLLRRERALETAAWMGLASALPVAVLWAELDKLRWLSGVGFALLAVPLQARVLRARARPPFRRPWLAAAGALASAMAVLLGVAGLGDADSASRVWRALPAEVEQNGWQILAAAGILWAAFLVPKILIVWAFRWRSFGRSCWLVSWTTAFAALPVLAAALFAGEYARVAHHSIADLATLSMAVLASLAFDWRLWRWKNPGRRALAAALLANLVCFAGLLVFVRLR